MNSQKLFIYEALLCDQFEGHYLQTEPNLLHHIILLTISSYKYQLS